MFEIGRSGCERPPDEGSIVVVIATDAPLLPHQLRRVARRAVLGLARTGTTGSTHSGDLMLAFSTARTGGDGRPGVRRAAFLSEAVIDPLLSATVEATEEAIVNALIAARTMEGVFGNTVYALPHDELARLLDRYAMLPDEPSPSLSSGLR